MVAVSAAPKVVRWKAQGIGESGFEAKVLEIWAATNLVKGFLPWQWANAKKFRLPNTHTFLTEKFFISSNSRNTRPFVRDNDFSDGNEIRTF